MFEEDNEGYGLYGFNQMILDPQATNAINTELISYLKPLTTSLKKNNIYKKVKLDLSDQKLNLIIKNKIHAELDKYR